MSAIGRRQLLQGCLVSPFLTRFGLLAAEDRSVRSSDEPPAWFRSCIVGLEVGPTGAQFGLSDPKDKRYAARFDGAEIVRRCVAANGQYLVIWARDGDYAYYDSKILRKAPGLEGRDPLREAVEEARKFSLPIIAYCVVQQGGHFLKEHPEWEMRGSDGSALGRFSYRSGYLAAMKEILTEQMAYGIDGFHIDMLDQGFGPPYGCWSEDSRQAFQAEFGRPMPEMAAGPSWDADWDDILEFRYRSSELFEQELAEHVRRENPAVTVDFNYHGNPPFSWEVGQRPVQHAVNGDFVTGETGVWGFSALGVGLNAEFYRSATPGLPYQVAIQRGVRMYHDQTTRPVNDMRWELFTLLAHGAFVTMVDKTAFDGSLDPVAYERFGEIFEEAISKRQHFEQKPVYDAGLYYSSRSRDWMGKENPGQWMQSFMGAHKALRFEQLQCGIALDENVSKSSLKHFPVLILCNAGILDSDEIELFREYVQEGGNLIVTGHTGLLNQYGKFEKRPDFESLIGASITEPLTSHDNWMRFLTSDLESPHWPPEWSVEDYPSDWNFLVKGPAAVYRPTTAIALGQLMRPARTKRQLEGKEGTEWPMSPEAAVGPAVLIQSLGKGKVVTFAGSPDYATASEHSIVEARKLLASCVRHLVPNPPIQITAPSNVQTVVTNDPESRILRVHFLGYNAPPQTTPATNRPYALPSLVEDPPLYRATVHCGDPIQSVNVLNVETEVEHAGQTVTLTINDIHETLLIGL
jgi:hypothetical protein